MPNKTFILVIDDDITVHGLVKSRLEKRDGLQVLSAEDGPAGLKLAAKKPPSLILLDWMMPGMDGLEVLAQLKEQGKTAWIPVYMLTGKGLMADIEEAFALGADGYFTKPIRLSELSDRVRKALKES